MLLIKSFCYTLALTTVTTCTLAEFATAATFNFSFSNVEGPVSGIVQGTLTLPDGDGTFAATSLIVNSAPSALGYTLPLDVLANFTNVLDNSFTVSSGVITARTFAATVQNSSAAFFLNSSIFGSFFSLQGGGSFDSGVLDSSNSTLTFTSVPTAAVPEPATVFGLLSVAGVGVLTKRRKSAK